jgi:hypothetical protein
MFGESNCYWPAVAATLLLGALPAFGQGGSPRGTATGTSAPIIQAFPKPQLGKSETRTPNRAANNAFNIEGLVIGTKAPVGEYRDFQCKESDQFVGYEWCQRAGPEPNSTDNSHVSLLRKQDGTVLYASRSTTPTLLNRAEALKEIARLSMSYSEHAKVLWMPHREGMPEAVIAYWGKVELQSLSTTSLSMLANGSPVREGLMLDYLGDFRRSAKLALPVYRLSGGAGRVWSASLLPDGRGHIRFVAIDASSFQNRQSEPPGAEASPTGSGPASGLRGDQGPDRPASTRDLHGIDRGQRRLTSRLLARRELGPAKAGPFCRRMALAGITLTPLVDHGLPLTGGQQLLNFRIEHRHLDVDRALRCLDLR